MLGFLTIIGNVLTTGFDRWGEVRKAKHETKVAQIKAKGRVDEIAANHVASWETIWAKNAAGSLKDEWCLFLLTAPLPFAFFEATRPYITDGFAFLDTLPPWYTGLLYIAVGASFGIRLVPHIGGAVGNLFGRNGK